MAMPLEGIRILDLSQILAGPFATRMLGDLGAEVIKIEQPGVGDGARHFEPYFLHGESAYFLAFNRNKKGITLNLQKPEAREVLYDLVRISDVVLDNFRPSVLPRLGVDYETLKKVNPKIITCSISGFGQEGPYRDRPAFDGVVQAMGGVMSVTGEPGGPPMYSGFPIGDVGGGYAAVVGVVTALLKRERTGEGSRVDISLLDVQVSLQAHLGQFYLVSGQVPQPIGNSHPSNVPVGAFLCKDGRYIQIHCATQRAYESLARCLAANVEGLADLTSDPRFASPRDRLENRQALEEILRNVFRTRSVDGWVELLEREGVPAGPVNTFDRVLSDPQVLLRNMVAEVPHPVQGTYKAAGNPIKMGQEERFAAPPTLGQHTDEILGGLLRYPAERIQSLRDAGAI